MEFYGSYNKEMYMELTHMCRGSCLYIIEQEVSRVMYFVTVCMHNHMLSYIQCIRTPNDATNNLKNMFTTNACA